MFIDSFRWSSATGCLKWLSPAPQCWQVHCAFLLSLVNTLFQHIAGVSIRTASAVNPLYVSENAPRGIQGFLTGLYDLSIVTGLTASIVYLENLVEHPSYASPYSWHSDLTTELSSTSGSAQYIIPLSLQVLPAVILVIDIFLPMSLLDILLRNHRTKLSKFWPSFVVYRWNIYMLWMY
ncbi:hypothetical protein F5Y03DRAFT_71701 [Xylaria venustula]|nr:hypothetical protein F5Y03DRAFT_71701 [Xylaria venustula]